MPVSMTYNMNINSSNCGVDDCQSILSTMQHHFKVCLKIEFTKPLSPPQRMAAIHNELMRLSTILFNLTSLIINFVDIYYTDVNVFMLQICLNNHKLTHLACHNTKDLTDETIITILKSCNQLTKIEFDFCHKLSDISIHCLDYSLLSNLHNVSITNCVKVTQSAIDALRARFPSYVDIIFVSNIANVQQGNNCVIC